MIISLAKGIVIFLILFIIDGFLESKKNKLWGQTVKLLEKLEKTNDESYKKLNEMYGKEMDEIGNRYPESFPFSLYVNIKELNRLNYLYGRFYD